MRKNVRSSVLMNLKPPTIEEVVASRAHLEFIESVFDEEWYKAWYGDIRKYEGTPLSHFLSFGLPEGRKPNHYFYPDWYAGRYEITKSGYGSPFVHYLTRGRFDGNWFNPIDDPQFIADEYKLQHPGEALPFLVTNNGIDRVSRWFSRLDYLDLHPDVRAAAAVPELHFLDHGLSEGRRVSAQVWIATTKPSGPSQSHLERVVDHFSVQGRNYHVISQGLSESVLRQIAAQAQIEPDVAAAGLKALGTVRLFHADDMSKRELVDCRDILRNVPMGQDAVIILPALRIGGAEKYAANLAAALRYSARRNVLVLTTDAWEPDDRAALNLEILVGLKGVQVTSLKERLQRSHRADTILALLLLRSGAKTLFVINSDLGLRVVKKYGRALSSEMKIFCAFFSEASLDRGVAFSARYARDILPTASILSDNEPALSLWRRRFEGVGTNKFICLPSLVEGPTERAFHAGLLERRASSEQTDRIRVLWVSRWEADKAIDVVIAVARAQDTIEVEVFGTPDGGSLIDLPSNLRFNGPTASPSQIPIESFDLYLFTSYFEGMPNIVLEMAAAGIPIVASDVGGLRDTFSDEAVSLVPMTGTVEEMAGQFVAAIQAVAAETPDNIERRIILARDQVLKRHGIEQFRANLETIMSDRRNVSDA